MSKKLFEASDESDNELQLSTNKDYAKSFNNFRKKELLKKFKDRGFDVSESDGSEDTSESSEEDEVLDPNFDKEFFKTLASLKSKDPAIYDKETRFFADLVADENGKHNVDGVGKGNDVAVGGGDTAGGAIKKEKKNKPVTLKDYERQIILERGGKFEDESDVEETEVNQRANSPTLVEEERRLKAEFKKVVNADDSEEEEFGGIFKKREKSKQEKDKEEEDFTKWLAGKQADLEENMKQQLEPLKDYWNSSKLPQGERFLRDYILSNGYANFNSSEIPTYDEIVGENLPLSEDEQELDKQAEFEHKYNFRFEEPDTEFIKRYPRTIDNSVRRTDDKRKQKRHEQKKRKELEKEQNMKELELVKEMRRKEIEAKIEKLKLVTGNEELGFRDDELEEDFDPEAHDRRMQEIFNEEYYEVDEGEEKPECPSDIDELKVEDWDNYDPQRDAENYYEDYVEPHCEDDDFNMDCDYDPTAAKRELEKELIENTKGKRNRRGRRNRFMEMLQETKPPFNPEDEKTYAEYIDEYYKMDYEDIIGDTPCRFKYVETMPNDFGLTIEEILLAKNKELNQWASLKKAIQIRPDQIEKKEQRLYKMKARNEDLKRKIFKSLYGEESDNENESEDKLISKETQPANVQDIGANEVSAVGSNDNSNVKKSKKKKRKAQTNTSINSVDKELQPVEVKKPKLDKSEPTEDQKAQNVNADATNTPVNADETVGGKQKRNEKKNNKTNTNNAVQKNLKPQAQPSMPQSQKKKPINKKYGEETHINNSQAIDKTSKREINPFRVQAKKNIQGGDKSAKNNSKYVMLPAMKLQIDENKHNTTTGTKLEPSREDNPFNKGGKVNLQKGNNTMKHNNKVNDNNTIKHNNKVNDNNTIKHNNKVSGNVNGNNTMKYNNANANNTMKHNNKVNGNNKFSAKSKFNNKRNINQNSRSTSTSTGVIDSGAKISDDRLKAYGINPRKYHKREKYGKKVEEAN